MATSSFMRQHYESRDVRTIRVLHEYGFSDNEMAEHLGLPPLVVRRIRGSLELTPNARGNTLAADRRRSAEAARLHPEQSLFGGQANHAGAVFLKMNDDRYFAPA